MKKFLHLRLLCALVMMVCGASGAWAEDLSVTYSYSDFSGGNSGNGGVEMDVTQHAPVTISATGYKKASNAYVQIYGTDVMNISVVGGYLTKVEITTTSGYAKDLTPSNGTAAVGTDKVSITWTKATDEKPRSVTLTNKNTSQVQIKEIKVYYAESSDKYTVTFNKGEGSCSVASATEEIAGAGVILPDATPSKKDYDFKGWSTTSGGERADAGKAGDTFVPNKDCTLYAVYGEPSIFIDFTTPKTYPAGFPTSGGESAYVTTEKAFEFAGETLLIQTANSGSAYRDNVNGYLVLGKNLKSFSAISGTCYVGIPGKVGMKLTKVIVEAKATDAVDINIYDSAAKEMSTSVSLAKTKTTAPFDLKNSDSDSGPAANTTYYLTFAPTVAAGKTMHIYSIELFYEKDATSVTIGETGYATFCPSYNVDVPSGVEVYAVTGATASSVSLTKSDAATIQAGEGVILKGASGPYTFDSTTSPAAKIANNKLVGVTGGKDLSANEAYILAASEGTAVFSLCNAGRLAAGKAYLPASEVPTTPEGAPMIIVFDDPTAISAVKSAQPQAQKGSFNLAGQQVGEAFKGIVIVNGKKVIK